MESQPQKRYQYEAIKADTEIRVLILQSAADFTETLEATMLHREMKYVVSDHDGSDNDNPGPQRVPYDAISYCWGPPDLSQDLSVDGRLLKISTNVSSMLRHLRKPAKVRRLWIDALCIDHTNDEEKGEQIRAMGTVFSRARKVHVWLGESTLEDHIPGIFEFFMESALLENGEENRVTVSNELKEAMAKFLARPWFCRRWVWQEIVLARDIIVHCGSHKISWNWMRTGIGSLKKKYVDKGTLILPSGPGQSLETLVALDRDSWHILDLLYSCHAAECSDPRDRLFSLYGLAFASSKPDHRRGFEYPVTYSDDWPSVYTTFAQVCIRRGYIAHLLHHCVCFGNLAEQDPTWPSWVPAWNKKRISQAWISDQDTRCSSEENREVFPRVGGRSGLKIFLTSWVPVQSGRSGRACDQIWGPVSNLVPDQAKRDFAAHSFTSQMLLFTRLLITSEWCTTISNNMPALALAETVLEALDRLAQYPNAPKFDSSRLEILAEVAAEDAFRMVRLLAAILLMEVSATPSYELAHKHSSFRDRKELLYAHIDELLEGYRPFSFTDESGETHFGICPPMAKGCDYIIRPPGMWSNFGFVVRPYENSMTKHQSVQQVFRLIGPCSLRCLCYARERVMVESGSIILV